MNTFSDYCKVLLEFGSLPANAIPSRFKDELELALEPFSLSVELVTEPHTLTYTGQERIVVVGSSNFPFDLEKDKSRDIVALVSSGSPALFSVGAPSAIQLAQQRKLLLQQQQSPANEISKISNTRGLITGPGPSPVLAYGSRDALRWTELVFRYMADRLPYAACSVEELINAQPEDLRYSKSSVLTQEGGSLKLESVLPASVKRSILKELVRMNYLIISRSLHETLKYYNATPAEEEEVVALYPEQARSTILNHIHLWPSQRFLLEFKLLFVDNVQTELDEKEEEISGNEIKSATSDEEGSDCNDGRYPGAGKRREFLIQCEFCSDNVCLGICCRKCNHPMHHTCAFEARKRSEDSSIICPNCVTRLTPVQEKYLKSIIASKSGTLDE